MVFLFLLLGLLPIVAGYGNSYGGQYLQPPPAFGYGYGPFPYEDSSEYKPKRGRRGPPGPPGPAAPKCTPKCSEKSFETKRVVDGKPVKWCVDMLYNPIGWDIKYYMNQNCMLNGGGSLTSFESKEELDGAYEQLKKNLDGLIGRDEAYAFIGAQKRIECANAPCGFANSYYTLDGVTNSTQIFKTSYFSDHSTYGTAKLCVAYQIATKKFVTYSCDQNVTEKPAKLFFCGKKASC